MDAATLAQLGISAWLELAVVLVLAVLLFGASKLPMLARWEDVPRRIGRRGREEPPDGTVDPPEGE